MTTIILHSNAQRKRHFKRIFGFVKVRYRGLENNANRLFATCALANLYLVRGNLLRVHRA